MVLGFSLVLTAGPKKEMKNFRFFFSWQPQAAISQAKIFNRDFFLFENFQLSDYFGDWLYYGFGDYVSSTTVASFTPLNYQRGDLLALRRVRTLSSGKTGQGFGLGFEFRTLWNLWVSVSYQQTPRFSISSTEEFDHIGIDYWNKQSEWDADNEKVYVYSVQLRRVNEVKSQRHEFKSINAQTALHWELGSQFFRVYPGIGLDVMHLIRESRIEDDCYLLFPFSGLLMQRFRWPRDEKEHKTILRPFTLLGLAALIKDWEFGIEARHIFTREDQSEVKYNAGFIMDASQSTWDFQLQKNLVVNIFLKFTF
jgi:hypothetical protein